MSWHRPIIHRHGPVRHSLRCGGLAALIGALLGTVVGGPGMAQGPVAQGAAGQGAGVHASAVATARARILSSTVRAGPGQSPAPAGEARPPAGEQLIARRCDGAAATDDCRLLIRDMP